MRIVLLIFIVTGLLSSSLKSEEKAEFNDPIQRQIEGWKVAYVVLHELAHADHDQVMGFDHPEVIDVFGHLGAGTLSGHSESAPRAVGSGNGQVGIQDRLAMPT